MNAKALTATRLMLVFALALVLMFVGATFAAAQDNGELYPLPDETPVTEVVTDTEAANTEARPATGVLPSDLARTGFDIGDPLALGALLVLVGGGILTGDRWYRRRQERSVTA